MDGGRERRGTYGEYEGTMDRKNERVGRWRCMLMMMMIMGFGD